MPIHGIIRTAHALGFYEKLQEVTANNLANANTDAFKAHRLTAQLKPGGEHAVPVESLDLQQGAMRDTGRALDVALEGRGFLVVKTGNGERLFRGGSLRLDAGGRLVTPEGDPVLGDDGPLVLQGSDVQVQRDGTVIVDDTIAGKLRLVDVDRPSALLKEGGGRYRTEEDPHAAGDACTVRQGSLEDANLDPILSMVDLVAIQRAYSANVDCMKCLDGVLGTITNEVGKA